MPCMKDYGKTWDYERGVYPRQRSNEMKIKYVVELRDGKVVDSTTEAVNPSDELAKTYEVRTLPNGGRTIRPE